MSYKAGDTLGSYLLLAECGVGAYGSVFLARNTITERQVALKIVYRQSRNCERELNGLRQYQTVCPHTNLLQIYHVDQNDECFWYTMDAADNRSKESNCYVPDTLANRLRECGRLPVEDIRKMALELVSALETIHHLGLLHRDVKPDNILWVNGHAKLGDIGLVSEKEQISIAGTPGFLPANVLAGLRKYSEMDDFYSLGKVIYCALTGMPVEKYPAWPDSLTLSGGEKLVEYYNLLCGGETEVSAEEYRKALSSGARSRWRLLYWLGVPMIGLLLLTTLFFLREPPRSPEPVSPQKPSLRENPAVTQDFAPALNTVTQPTEQVTEVPATVAEPLRDLWEANRDRFKKITQDFPENPKILARKEKFLEIVAMILSACSSKFFWGEVYTEPLNENSIWSASALAEANGDEFDLEEFKKVYAEKYGKFLSYLGTYPEREQAVYQYMTLKRLENHSRFFLNRAFVRMADTPTNRAKLNNAFEIWHRWYRELLQAEKKIPEVSETEIQENTLSYWDDRCAKLLAKYPDSEKANRICWIDYRDKFSSYSTYYVKEPWYSELKEQIFSRLVSEVERNDVQSFMRTNREQSTPENEKKYLYNIRWVELSEEAKKRYFAQPVMQLLQEYRNLQTKDLEHRWRFLLQVSSSGQDKSILSFRLSEIREKFAEMENSFKRRAELAAQIEKLPSE